jgi:hypothetical protein
MDTTLRPRPDRKKKSPLALTVSVILHLAAGAVLLRVVTLGISASQLGKIRENTVPIPGERLQYIRVAPGPSIIKPPETAPTTERRPAAPPPSGPKALVAPTEIPQGVAAPVTRDTGSTAAGANGSGDGTTMERGAPVAARGVIPGYGDPRLWGAPTSGNLRRSGTDQIDSVIVATLRSARDSADSASRMTGRAPGDWTKTDANGGKWGWDQQGIRLGKFTIPNALLGALPLNAQRGLISNPIERDRNSRLALMRDEILRNSARGVGEDDFKKAVKALRARRDQERAERLRLAAAATGRLETTPTTPPPSAPDR